MRINNPNDPSSVMLGESLARLVRNARESNVDPSAPLLPPEVVNAAPQFIRSDGAATLQMMAVAEGPKSQMINYNPEVYAGCLERLDNYFFWQVCHWQLEKTELLHG